MVQVYILPVPQKYQPDSQPFKYPKHNEDYGVEQDFFKYLLAHPNLITEDPTKADWHYLPVYWTRYKRNARFGYCSLDDMEKEIGQVILNDKKTFTICQHKDAPYIPLGNTILFLASRTTKEGIDIPLISTRHTLPKALPPKKYLASFIGRLRTHPIRKEMFRQLKEREDILIIRGNKGEKVFVNTILMSQLSLCPRGVGGSSFRLFESMQLGVAPVVLGDLDTRPFKKFIDWDKVSYYVPTVEALKDLFDKPRKKKYLDKGKRAAALWENALSYQKWCKFVFMELKKLK